MLCKKKVLIVLSVLIITGIYAGRVYEVNKDNYKADVTYIADTNAVIPGDVCDENGNITEFSRQLNKLKVTVSKQKLYDTAAFVDEFPEIKQFYRYTGSQFELMSAPEAIQGMRNIVYLELDFRNASEEILNVPYNLYQLYVNRSFNNGIYPMMVEELNKASGVAILPGHDYTVRLAYELPRSRFNKNNYENLEAQEFSLSVSGYPDEKHIKLSHMERVKADRAQQVAYKKLIGEDKTEPDSKELEDTKMGTILGMNDTVISNGLKITLDSCEIVSNVNDCDRVYGKRVGGEFYTDEIDENGDVIWPYKNDGFETICHMVYVTLKITNGTDDERILPLNNYDLYNYNGKTNSGGGNIYLSENIIHEVETSNVYVFPPNSTSRVTFERYVADPEPMPKKYKWFIEEDRELYMECSLWDKSWANLTKNIPANGIFLRVH